MAASSSPSSPPGGASGSRSYNFKVVLLGEGAVGKTSLVLRYVEGKFNDKHITTLQEERGGTSMAQGYQYNTVAKLASFLTKKLNISGKRINLAIWDTAGQERFHALGPIYYRDSNGALLVYDITDEDSFQKVKKWVKELRKMLGNDICLSIAGNKIDLDKQRSVSAEEAEQYASSVGARHHHTSAKLGKGIDELFLDLSAAMLESTRQENEEEGGRKGRSSASRNVLVVDDDQVENANAKAGCCG